MEDNNLRFINVRKRESKAGREKEVRRRICFIYPHSIPSERNRVIYQRLKILSNYYFMVFFTVGKYHIPVELEKR